MSKYFPRQLLFRLRNEIPLEQVIAEHLNWPGKRRNGRFVFVCPGCGESLTAVNPRTNLGRCFRCEENFNAIDFVMLATGRDFVEGATSSPNCRPPGHPRPLPPPPTDSPPPRLPGSRHELQRPRLYVSHSLGLPVSNNSGLSNYQSRLALWRAVDKKPLGRQRGPRGTMSTVLDGDCRGNVHCRTACATAIARR